MNYLTKLNELHKKEIAAHLEYKSHLSQNKEKIENYIYLCLLKNDIHSSPRLSTLTKEETNWVAWFTDGNRDVEEELFLNISESDLVAAIETELNKF